MFIVCFPFKNYSECKDLHWWRLLKTYIHYLSDSLWHVTHVTSLSWPPDLWQSLLHHANDTSCVTFCEKITSDMWEVAISGDWLPVGPSSHETMWKSFHGYRMSDDLPAQWTRLLDSCNVHSKHIVEQLLLQHILRLLLLTLRERNAANQVEEVAPSVNLVQAQLTKGPRHRRSERLKVSETEGPGDRRSRRLKVRETN